MTELSFDQLIEQRSAIFRDKGVLSPHYVPETLHYRDNEIKRIMTCIAPTLQGKKATNALIYGKTGSGKSICAKKVLQKLSEQENDGVGSVYLNCRIYDSRYKILQKTLSEFDLDIAKTGHSFSLLYEKALELLQKGKHVVLVLDEIDLVKDIDSLVYTLTRANDDLSNGSISMVGISNKITFKQKLDARSRSSLCEEEIVFTPYNATQLQGILSQRLSLAFKEDGLVEQSAVNLAAAIAAGENGDARYALTLLLRAGELAANNNLKKVTDGEVERARVAADEDKARELISSLPEHLQFVLYSLAVVSQDVQYKRLVESEDGDKLFFSGEVYDRYCSMCKKMGKEPRTARWYREYIHELETLGLLVSVHSGKGIRGQATLIKPVYAAEKIRKIIEENTLQ